MADLLDPFVIALGAGAVLAIYLVALEGVTLVYVRYRSQVEGQKERLEPEIRAGIIDRLDREEPDWASWAAGLSAREREVAETVLDRYLRKLDGQGKATLEEAGRALGLAERSRAGLESGDYYDRLLALGWLALLEEPVDPDLLAECCEDDAEMRAAAARVLYATDAPEAQRAGTQLLLEDGSERMTVFGMDTLYRLNRGDPVVLFEYASEHASGWSTPVLAQVLLVTAQFADVGSELPVDWIVDALWLGSETVRIEAVRALGALGWQSDIRERVDLVRLVDDPSPEVRQAVCELLGAWRTDDAVRTLETVAVIDPDRRVQVAAVEELVAAGETDALSGTAAFRWVSERPAAPGTEGHAWL